MAKDKVGCIIKLSALRQFASACKEMAGLDTVAVSFLRLVTSSGSWVLLLCRETFLCHTRSPQLVIHMIRVLRGHSTATAGSELESDHAAPRALEFGI